MDTTKIFWLVYPMDTTKFFWLVYPMDTTKIFRAYSFASALTKKQEQNDLSLSTTQLQFLQHKHCAPLL